MRAIFGIIAGLAVALGLGIALFIATDSPKSPESSPGAPDAKDDRAALHDLIRRTEAANNEGDVDAWVDGFAPDAVYMPPGSPAVTDPAGIREMAELGFSQARTDITMTPDEIEIHGDWAFARIRVAGTAILTSGGEPLTIDMKEIVVFRRQPDGAWKIARLIANRNHH